MSEESRQFPDSQVRMNNLPKLMGWTKSSYLLMSGFVLVVALIAYIWWPLAEEYLAYIDWEGKWWLYIDWLLIGIFLFMSLMIMARADIRRDAIIVFVGLAGGLVIESWGTQTEIWTYYTAERPPLWIIPAWPIASLSIDRMVKIGGKFLPGEESKFYKYAYWLTFIPFFALMLFFVWPTMDKSLTIMSVILVTFLLITPTDHRMAWVTFLMGSALGYFLERWGTTRLCWTYYTLEQPPLFAILAHGMAAVAFWRSARVMKLTIQKLKEILKLAPQKSL